MTLPRSTGVPALLHLDGLSVDPPSMVRGYERPVRAGIKRSIRLGGHHWVQEHKAAHAAAVPLRRVAVAVAMSQRDELAAAAEIARRDRVLRLRCVLVIDRRNSSAPVGQYLCHNQVRSTVNM